MLTTSYRCGLLRRHHQAVKQKSALPRVRSIAARQMVNIFFCCSQAGDPQAIATS
jgi:hypothetical protein